MRTHVRTSLAWLVLLAAGAASCGSTGPGLPDDGLSVLFVGNSLTSTNDLPGMVAAQTTVPVLGVPVESHALKGLDSLLSIVQMPGGVPVGTLAIGKAGAINAALLAIAILATTDATLRARLQAFRANQTARVKADTLS